MYQNQSKNLHADHLADLQASGLTPSTIEAAGIYSVSVEDFPSKLGERANDVKSIMGFPYSGCGGFERLKPFWQPGREGPKYIQSPGSDNHLYMPPTIDLSGDSSLIVVEGEKKALALWQTGCQVVGLGGVWSWRGRGKGQATEDKSQPVADLGKVNWKRPVIIVFDSDGHTNFDIRIAAFHLARELGQRGATVSILFLPPGEGGAKAGADDFLVVYGIKEFHGLLKTAWPFNPAWEDLESEVQWQSRELTPQTPNSQLLKALTNLATVLAKMGHLEVERVLGDLQTRLSLKGSDLSALRKDIKAARKVKEVSLQKNIASKGLEDLKETPFLHPACDFANGHMIVGFRVHEPNGENGLILVVSDGDRISPYVNPEKIEIGGKTFRLKKTGTPPFIDDTWGLPNLKSFVKGPTKPKRLYQDIVGALHTYLDLPEPAYGLIASWIVGTYLCHAFNAFPFLHPFGPKETGKSKSLEVKRELCCNAWKGRDLTPAALGDTMEAMRGTVLLDQAEFLTDHLIGLLADSYKKAGGRRRVVEITKVGRVVLEFSTYGPKAFASTKDLDPDLRDRCIQVPMTRTTKRLPDLDGSDNLWRTLRDKIYRFVLTAFKMVQQNYAASQGDGTRATELWRPLLAILKALDVPLGEIEAVYQFFKQGMSQNRYELSPWEAALFDALRSRAQKEAQIFTMTANDIATAMPIDGDGPNNTWVGNTLARFHLCKDKTRRTVQGQKDTVYFFEPDKVIELSAIYLRESPSDDLSGLSGRRIIS